MTLSGKVVEVHAARVTSNADPDKKGRIKISCIGLLGDDKTALPMWVEPKFDWGWFYIPDVGELIDIECITGSAQDESQNQMSIDNLNIKWLGKRYYNASKDVPTPINPQFIDTAYAKRRGFATPLGHVFVFDDTENSSSIKITWVPAPKSDEATKRTTIEIDSKGNFHLNILDLHKIDVTPEKVAITLGGGNALTLDNHDAQALAKFGDGAGHVCVVEELQSYIKSVVQYLENAVVITGQGPSSTVLLSNGPAPIWNPALINSKHVSIPKNP